MWRRAVLTAFSSHRALAAQAAQKQTRSSQAPGFGLFAAVAVAAAGSALVSSPVLLEGEADPRNAAPTSWERMKRSLTGNYENRIRLFSHPLKVFQYFASVTDKHGEKLMTPMDFVVSLLPYQAGETSAGLRARLQSRVLTSIEHLKLADTDGDGYISYSEYLFFLMLLATPEHHFKVAFRVLDADGSGHVDRDEFLQLLANNTNHAAMRQGSRERSRTNQKTHKSGLVEHFFGKDGKGHLDFATFSAFLRGLQREMLRIEFVCYDVDENDSISAQDFARSLINYVPSSAAGPYLARIAHLRSNKRISFETFVSFNMILSRIDDIEFALSMYSEAGAAQHHGGDFTRADLKRAVRVTTGVELDDSVIDTVFYVFDSNGDGTLNEAEFFRVTAGRHARGLDRPRDTGFVRFMSKAVECYNAR